MKVLFSLLKYLFVVMIVGTVIATISGGVFFLYFARDLPNIITVADYKPSVVTKVLGKNDVLVGDFYEQKRYLIPLENIPDHIIKCFVAAEDDRFFEHQGIDLQGMLRAAFVNLKAGHVVQGGSTITQQVAKSLLLTPERSFMRKIKEVLLANRMERNLSKKEILYLYLNQIYFGEGAYGIEAASKVYFGKEAKELSLGEAAILAGLPQAPSRYSPLHNPKKAKERQQYVLHRLGENGTISHSKMEETIREPVKVLLPQELNTKYAPYYVEYLRKYLLEKYGKDELYNKGLVVKTPLDPELSIHATKAVREGLRTVDKRHGYRGPISKNKTAQEVTEALEEVKEFNITRKFPYKVILNDGRFAETLQERFPDMKSELELFDDNELYKGIVTLVDDAKKEVIVNLGLLKAVLPLEKMQWAYPAKAQGDPEAATIQRPSQALTKGDMIYVRMVSKNAGKMPVVSLEQIPQVQGALLSLDNKTGDVYTMVGGYDFDASEFNRAVQAERQPGSAFKPIIYSAAVDKGYTPVTLIQDSPLVFTSGDEKWKPLNYDEHFSGDTTFRLALIKSMNIPTIKIVQDIGIPYLIDYAKRLGVSKSLAPDYSIALGSSAISLLDLARVYAIFPRSGRRIKAVFINKIFDRDGKILEENKPTPDALTQSVLVAVSKPVTVAGELQAEAKNGDAPPRGEWTPDPADAERVLDPRTAYVMTHLMNEVATVGTGAEAKNLKRAAAGKTGTTNDYIDAWFMGFTPQITTGVWVGFDVQRSLGAKGTGGLTALPIWIDYMREAVKNLPDVQFNAPSGVTFAYINGATGRVVSPKTPGAIREAFIEGTLVNGGRISSGSNHGVGGSKSRDADTDDFLKEDFQ